MADILTDDDVKKLTPRPNGTEQVFRRVFGVRGLLLRVGKRKKTFELRAEGERPFRRVLGEHPAISVAAAIATAQEMWRRHDAKPPLPIDAPAKDEHTIATALPLFQAWLIAKGRSDKTLAAYASAFNRLSDHIKRLPLQKLLDDRTLMLNEVARIKEARHNQKLKRKGQAAATQSAVFVSALFTYMRDQAGLTLVGSPVSMCVMVDKKTKQPVLGVDDMKSWWEVVQKISNEIVREALLFELLTGLRRGSLEALRCKDIDLRNGCVHVAIAKGGEEKAFDLILTRPMIRCLWRARKAGRRLYPEHAKVWCFAGERGHIRGNRLTKIVLGKMVLDKAVLAKVGVQPEKDKDKVVLKANHALRRGYSTAARAAGVDEDVISKLLNHGAKGLLSRYVMTSHLGKMLYGAQCDISASIIKALGQPHGLA
jgi:integrase